MSRRGENIYKRSDGRWEGRFIKSRDATGKAVYKSVYAHSYNEIKEKLRSCCMSANKEINESKRSVFDNIAGQWLSSVRLRCKISTYNKYKNVCKNYISPVIGNIEICKVNIKMIEEILSINSGLSPKTRNDILSVIKLIAAYSSDSGYEINLNLHNLSVRQESREMRVLTFDEQAILSEYLIKGHDFCRIGVLLSLYTGIRIGELCALKYEDIDIEGSNLYIRKTMQRVQIENMDHKTEVIISEPKSKKSMRFIPIPHDLTEIIKDTYNGFNGNDYILTGKSDRYIEPRALEYRFRKYTQECELDNVNFHALRHTFATRCVEAGFDIKTLSEILGHVNVNITLNRYVHSSPELKRANMDKLNIIINQ